jgi:hypothetical protein
VRAVTSTLFETPDEHYWLLADQRVSQLIVERTSVRVQSWGLEGSIEIRISAPFALTLPTGGSRRLDPAEPERLAPLLALVGHLLKSLVVNRDGALTIEMREGAKIEAESSGRAGAWEVQGGGALEGVGYESGGGL